MTRKRLMLFTLPECEVCAEAKPVFERFKKTVGKDRGIQCEVFDLTETDLETFPLQPPEQVPSYLYVELHATGTQEPPFDKQAVHEASSAGRLRTIEGESLTIDQLKKLCFGTLSTWF